MLDDDAIEVGGDGPLFQIEDDLFVGHLPGPAFFLSGEEHGAPAVFEPIIDRDDEVPERYWAPEVAGLGRRALALLVDQLLLLAVLGIFFLGALLALQRNGLTTGFLPGRRRLAGFGPALRAARRAAQPRLLHLLSRVHGAHPGQGAGWDRGPDRRRRSHRLGQGDPALVRCGPRPGVCRRRPLLGCFRAAPSRLGRSDFRDGGCPTATGPP